MDKISPSFVVTEILEIVQVSLAKGFTKTHSRTTPGLIVTTKGKVSYRYNGTRYISDAYHPLLMPQDAEYKITSDEDSISIVINFTCAEPYYSDIIQQCTANFSKQALKMENLWVLKLRF